MLVKEAGRQLIKQDCGSSRSSALLNIRESLLEIKVIVKTFCRDVRSVSFAIAVSLDTITLLRKDGESYGLFGLHWVRNSELIVKAKFIMYFFAVPHPTPSFPCALSV